MSSFQSKTINEYEKNGWIVLKIIKLSDSGFPDLLAMKEGETDVWIECKEKNDTLKPLQMFRIDQLNSLGKIAFCLQDGKGIIYPENLEI